MNRLRDLRKSRGMTLEKLGKMINIQKSTVAKYEKGTVEMGTSILEKLSGIFGVSIDYIVNNPNANLIPQEIPAPHDEKYSELIAMSKNLDGENYKTVVKFIKLLTKNAERNKQSQLSDDETSLINDYRALDNADKLMIKNMAGKLRLVVDNARQGQLQSGSNISQVEVGNVESPTNITETQPIG